MSDVHIARIEESVENTNRGALAAAVAIKEKALDARRAAPPARYEISRAQHTCSHSDGSPDQRGVRSVGLREFGSAHEQFTTTCTELERTLSGNGIMIRGRFDNGTEGALLSADLLRDNQSWPPTLLSDQRILLLGARGELHVFYPVLHEVRFESITAASGRQPCIPLSI